MLKMRQGVHQPLYKRVSSEDCLVQRESASGITVWHRSYAREYSGISGLQDG